MPAERRRALSAAAAALIVLGSLAGCAVKTADSAPGASGDRQQPSGAADDAGRGGQTDAGAGQDGDDATAAATQRLEDCARFAELLAIDPSSTELDDVDAFGPYVIDDRLLLNRMTSQGACRYAEPNGPEGSAQLLLNVAEFEGGDYPATTVFQAPPAIVDAAVVPGGESHYETSGSVAEDGVYGWGSSTFDGRPYGVCQFAHGSQVITALYLDRGAAEDVRGCMAAIRPIVEHLGA